ncbi:hypothetical protein Tco_0818591 [Tanacetum coccineum]
MDYHHLFTEFNVGTARQACLNMEVRMRTEYYLSERKSLESECEKQAGLLKAKDDEVENLKAQLLLKEAKAAEVARLRAQVAELQSSVDAKGLEVKDLNVVVKRSTLIGVWTPLVYPLSIENLTGEAGNSDDVSATTVTTTVLSTTFASANSVPPITVEDYEIVGTDSLEDAQGNGQGNVAIFPTIEFEKEELDTTPERDPPS